jgi:hypothetical protein
VFGISAFADTPFASLAGSSFNSSVSETATATDAVSSKQTFASAVTETGTASDAVSSLARFISAVTETGTATDAVSGFQGFISAVTETGTATDSTVGFITFPTSIAESGTATDAVSSLQTFSSLIAEAATATDSITGSFLWNLIDDTQTPNWTSISTGEISIGMDSTFGGSAFASSPVSGLSWTYIPDVGWTLINSSTTTTWQVIGTVN